MPGASRRWKKRENVELYECWKIKYGNLLGVAFNVFYAVFFFLSFLCEMAAPSRTNFPMLCECLKCFKYFLDTNTNIIYLCAKHLSQILTYLCLCKDFKVVFASIVQNIQMKTGWIYINFKICSFIKLFAIFFFIFLELLFYLISCF